MARKLKIPHTYVIVFSFIIAAAILTWILPGGEFERKTVDIGGTQREVIVQDSFHPAEKSPQTWQVFSALFAAALEMPASFAIVSTSSAFVIALSSLVVVKCCFDRSYCSLIKHSLFKSQAQIRPHTEFRSPSDGV